MAKVKWMLITLLASLSMIGYFLFAYSFNRTQHWQMFTVYFVLFVISVALVLFLKRIKWIWFIFSFGLAFRIIFLLASPHLSDDFFRFTWDGELNLDGISVFEFKPENHAHFFQSDSLLAEKYAKLFRASTNEFPDGMNSERYYSIYPAVNQSIFTISSAIGDPNKGNLIVMRILIIIAEIVSFFLLRALLIKRKMSSTLVGLYWFNPLVIIELTGNLHFEVFAILFVLLALYFLDLKRTGASSIAISLAIHSKLNPLFFIGALFRKVALKVFVIYCLIVTIVTIILFASILDLSTFWNFKESVGLYFSWFGFNGGVYLFLRECGIYLFDTNYASTLSVVLPIITLSLMALISINSKLTISHKLLLIYMVYFSLSPIVHPWYLTLLIPLAIMSKKIYPIVWTLLVFFTYSAYGESYHEYYSLVFTEYFIVFILMYLECSKRWKVFEGLKEKLFKTEVVTQ